MHGLGNDFVIIEDALPPRPLIIAASNRRRGIGCDQFISVALDAHGTTHMRIWNPDGSESGACGNATRCVALLLMRQRKIECLHVRTVAAELRCWISPMGVTVDMGMPRDVLLMHGKEVNVDVERVGLVNMGNPHCVFFVTDAMDVNVAEIGSAVECHERFPDRTNVEFCHVLDRDRLRMRVWERGAGLTEACGSGACASVVVGVMLGLLERKCVVVLDGGLLEIEWTNNNRLLMSGPASLSFEGRFGPDLIQEARQAAHAKGTFNAKGP